MKLKKIFRSISYVLIAIIFSISLSGCGKKTATADPNASKIVIWSFESEDAWKTVIRNFQNKNKGYTVVYERQVFDSNYENRVLNSILSTGTPDIWSMPSDWVYRHKEKLVPEPDSLVKSLNIDGFVPSVKNSVTFDNKIYALSPSAEPLMIYYNNYVFQQKLKEIQQNSKDNDYKTRTKTLLEGFPKTWTDFVETAKLLTVKNGNDITFAGAALGTSKVTNSQDILYLMMLQNETDIISSDYHLATFNLPKDTTTGSNDIPGKRALEFYTSFANPASPNYCWNDSFGSDIEAFGNGKVAMIFGYSSLQNTLVQKYPNLSYRKAFVPQIDQDSTKIKDYAKFNAFGVSILSRNPGLAWSLVGSLATESSNDFNSVNRLYSSSKAAGYDININNRTPGNPEKLSLATAESLVKGRFPGEFDFYIRSAIGAVNSGTQNSQAALDLVSNQITEILRKTDW